MWGWLGSIFSGLESIFQGISSLPSLIWNNFKTAFDTVFGWLGSILEGILNLPSLIWNGFKSAFDTVFGWLSDIFDNIVELPKLILDGIKEIFIPDTESIDFIFASALESISSKFGFQEFHFDSLVSNSSQPTDIEGSYSLNGVGSLNVKFFDTHYLIKGVNFFRPFIRGFVILMLLIYNIRMFLAFIGHDLGASAYGQAVAEKRMESKKGG